MDEATTYLGASSKHLHCENYKFEPNTPLKVFKRDEICNQVTWIDISGCNGILDATTFKNLPNLEIIGMNKCNIEKIEDDTFSAVPKLNSLNVRKSVFPLDENVFKNCEKLDNIHFIQIENGLNSSLIFKDLKNLEYLMIDHTAGLQLCEDTFSGLETLKCLFIQNCNIGGFSERVFEPLVNLERFYFTGNTLQEFNLNAFLTLENLSILGMYGNSLSSPECPLLIDYQIFMQLPNLDTISFPQENIRLLKYEHFKNLKNVQLVIGKAEDDIIDMLEEKNIGIQWTSDSDLTEEVDLNDPNIQICA